MKAYLDYRADARETLQGQWNDAALMTLVLLGFAVLFSVCPMFIVDTPSRVSLMADGFCNVLTILLVGPLEFAMYNVFLSMKRQELQSAPLNAMFKFFTGDWSRYIVALILETIIIVLISIPTLGIGGIIFSYAYKMVPYLLRDYPELTAKEALKLSREIMRGYKWDLFVLELTFIGWVLLSILTMGLGFLWLVPYIYTTEAHYYDDLKAEVVVEE